RHFVTHPLDTSSYALSLHDALPIYVKQRGIWILKFRDFTIKDIRLGVRSRTALKSALKFFTENGYNTPQLPSGELPFLRQLVASDRKSTRLNSSHVSISYAVLCLKK